MRTSRFQAAAHVRASLLTAAAVAVSLSVTLPTQLVAQRRPGVGMGFYTTTGLLTADVEAGSVTSSTETARAPSFALSLLVTTGFKRVPKRAWIAGVRANALSLGNGRMCIVIPGTDSCQSPRFVERAALLAGGAFDIRSTILRAMVGPALYSVELAGTRIGTSLRVDFAAPRLSGPTPTLFFTRTFLGSQRGEAVGLSTLGAGFRWVRKT